MRRDRSDHRKKATLKTRIARRLLATGLLAAILIAPAGLGPMAAASTAHTRAVDQNPTATNPPSGGTTTGSDRTGRQGTTTAPAQTSVTSTGGNATEPATRRNPSNTHPLLTGSSTNIRLTVSAGATGDGPADQAACDRFADWINQNIGILEGHLGSNNQPGITDAAEAIEAIEDAAMDSGCFIIY